MATSKKPAKIIGSRELVDILDLQLRGVPAKVDTGADSSAIWASNVRIDGDTLKYCLFAPGSAFYQNLDISTQAFRTTSVKNSFGNAEFRYKVRLRLRVGNSTMTTWVTLADRSHNTYPILLGKNFLKNRFVVDVSQVNLHGTNDGAADAAILLLSAKPQPLQKFVTEMAQYNVAPVNYVCIGYDQLVYYISESHTRVSAAADQKRDIAEYRLTYFKSHGSNSELAFAAAEYLHFRNRRFIDEELSSYVSGSKLSECMKLSCHDLPVPDTLCGVTSLLRERYDDIVAQLGSPFVLKEIKSDQGKNNYFVSNKKDFEHILDSAPGDYVFMAQKFVENEGFLRLLVMGKEVVLGVQRTPTAHVNQLKSHLNKPSGGKNATKLELSNLGGDIQELAIKAASIMHRQVAGVDIIQDKHSKKWYILEVNNAPQIRGGSHVDEKARALAKYFDKELNR